MRESWRLELAMNGGPMNDPPVARVLAGLDSKVPPDYYVLHGRW